MIVIATLLAAGGGFAFAQSSSPSQPHKAYRWSENTAVAPAEVGRQRAETALATDTDGHVWLSYLDAEYKRLPSGMWIDWPRKVMLLSSSNEGKSFAHIRNLSEIGGDEALAAGPKGDLYASWIQYSNNQRKIVFQRIARSEQTAAPVECLGSAPDTLYDQSHVHVADDGTVHIFGVDIATRFDRAARKVVQPAQLVYARSRDGLKSCTDQKRLDSLGELPQAATIAQGLLVVGPEGYIISSNGGVSFTPRTRYRFGDKLARLAGSPDRRTAYVVGDSGRDGLWVHLTVDGGNAWRKTRVDTAAKASAWRYPAIAVEQSGRVHVVWMDDRTGYGAVYHAYSDDGARSFSENARISDRPFAFPSSAPPPPPGTQNGTWIGDYLSLTVTHGKVVAAWSDQRAGIGRSTVYTATGVPQ